MDKLSYALGLTLGNSLKNGGFASLNYDEFTAGVRDLIEDKDLKMSQEEAKTILDAYFDALQNKMNEENIEAGKAFFAENGKRKGVVTTESGLQYEVIKEGDGKIPTASDSVTVHYHGTLLNGEVFDSSVVRGEPATFGVTQVIPGWVEALQLMPTGSKWKLFIPSDLAYGARGASAQIGPHTSLIFEVELIEIV